MGFSACLLSGLVFVGLIGGGGGPNAYTGRSASEIYDFSQEPFVYVGPNTALEPGIFYYSVLELPKSYLPYEADVMSSPIDNLPSALQYPRLHLGYATIVPNSTVATDQLKRRTTTSLPGHTTIMVNAMGWDIDLLLDALNSGALAAGKGRFIGGGFMIANQTVIWDPVLSVKSAGEIEGNVDPWRRYRKGFFSWGTVGRPTLNPLVPYTQSKQSWWHTSAHDYNYIPYEYLATMMEAIVMRANMPMRIVTDPTISPYNENIAKYPNRNPVQWRRLKEFLASNSTRLGSVTRTIDGVNRTTSEVNSSLPSMYDLVEGANQKLYSSWGCEL